MGRRIKAITKRDVAEPRSGRGAERIRNVLQAAVENASTVRSSLLTKLFDERRDIDAECGYPKSISIEQYNTLYQREGIARRVVTLFPEDSWSDDPIVYESEDPNEVTEFEKAWNDMVRDKHVYHYLQRVDELSGVGRFGILLLGFNDGGELHEPLPSMDERGEVTTNNELSLLYMRPFSEASVRIKQREKDPTNPRFGKPLMYEVIFEDDIGDLSDMEKQAVTGDISKSSIKTQARHVHWSRVLHVADNKKTSEIFGTPRMEAVYNRLYDIRKILSGSGEMFWKGAFPGYSFEMSPEAAADGAVVDTESLREELEKYSNGLQRYLALTGLTAKSLAPQVSDPAGHIETQIRAIAITLGVPFRIFLGTEEAKLASQQDTTTWNKRVNKRQDKYLTPMIIRPFIERLIAVGALPSPSEENQYTVQWPDLNSPTDKDKIEVAKMKAEAYAKYLAGNVDALIPPYEWLVMVMGMEQKEAEQILEAAQEQIEETEEREAEDEAAMRKRLEKEEAERAALETQQRQAARAEDEEE